MDSKLAVLLDNTYYIQKNVVINLNTVCQKVSFFGSFFLFHDEARDFDNNNHFISCT